MKLRNSRWPAAIAMAGSAVVLTLTAANAFQSHSGDDEQTVAPSPRDTLTRPGRGGTYTVLSWNDLGMHCMDGDYSVFAILPPYNNLHAQAIDSSGHLVKTPGLPVVYQGIADPSGSINLTSIGKTTFWTYVLPLFGASPPPDTGLAGYKMPGTSNAAQVMGFDTTYYQFVATGIPITPYDDKGNKNYYPLMNVVAKDSSGKLLAQAAAVLPISDEMSCTACHASGVGTPPPTGWVYDPNPQRDFRLNILKWHDSLQAGNTTYIASLQTAGYNTSGLYATVQGGTPILCAKCHASNALPGTGIAGVPPLTQSVHGFHATSIDPVTGLPLNDSENRQACYNCHPGSTTRCLRGVMGNAVAADGSLEIQCQNCHGQMSDVGASSRQGWYDEPSCGNCHTGTATHNNGQIRYTSVFTSPGVPRIPIDNTYNTTPNVPQAPYSLYRFSSGHGSLQCEACHGSTHAEYPGSHPNDNLQSTSLQGHAGTIEECSTCHKSGVVTSNGGPHGMHPVGSSWVNSHGNFAEGNTRACQNCHGADYKGTVLSYAFTTRTLTSDYGTLKTWRGFQISCYACHNGPNSEGRTPNRPPAVSNTTLSATGTNGANLTLQGTDPDGNALTFRIVSQPANGTVALNGNVATFYAFSGFTGTDSFTFAAWDGNINSNLATVTVTVH